MSERRTQHVKALDGRLPTPDQLRQLGNMTAHAFLHIRSTRDLELARALADAFHNLPRVVYEPCFLWSQVLMFLEGFERLYPEAGCGYIAAFDQIVGFPGAPAARGR